MYLIF
jgi:hypothetical protein